MRAMVLNQLCSLEENKTPLKLVNLPEPVPGERDILIKVSACGVYHTELDEIEGRTPPPHLPDPNVKVFVFARSAEERAFSRDLGAVWAGDSAEESPEKLDSIIDTTPAWKPIVGALKNLEPGGRLVINAIRKEEVDKDCLLQLDYSTHLWQEKEIKSVANICRQDVSEFLTLAAEMRIQPEIQEFALEEANVALIELKTRKIRGAKVLRID